MQDFFEKKECLLFIGVRREVPERFPKKSAFFKGNSAILI
jgi:hypothetical protein